MLEADDDDDDDDDDNDDSGGGGGGDGHPQNSQVAKKGDLADINPGNPRSLPTLTVCCPKNLYLPSFWCGSPKPVGAAFPTSLESAPESPYTSQGFKVSQPSDVATKKPEIHGRPHLAIGNKAVQIPGRKLQWQPQPKTHEFLAESSRCSTNCVIGPTQIVAFAARNRTGAKPSWLSMVLWGDWMPSDCTS